MPFEYGIIPVVGPHSYGNHTFVLYRRPSTSPLLSTLANYDVDNIYGWWHINITRDFEGNFEVYINDTLGITYTDTTHTSSDLFTFTAEAGISLDNIVVVPYPQPPPPLPWELIAIGGGVAVGVIVLAIVFLRRR